MFRIHLATNRPSLQEDIHRRNHPAMLAALPKTRWKLAPDIPEKNRIFELVQVIHEVFPRF